VCTLTHSLCVFWRILPQELYFILHISSSLTGPFSLFYSLSLYLLLSLSVSLSLYLSLSFSVYFSLSLCIFPSLSLCISLSLSLSLSISLFLSFPLSPCGVRVWSFPLNLQCQVLALGHKSKLGLCGWEKRGATRLKKNLAGHKVRGAGLAH
jgi:hypothetical protein